MEPQQSIRSAAASMVGERDGLSAKTTLLVRTMMIKT